MKPPGFDYTRATSVDHALAVLAEQGDDARIIAGGQSLVPLLNFRLARPSLLLDVSRLGELSYVRRRDGLLRIGATTKQAMLERSSIARRLWGLLTEALGQLGHAPIRSMGTVGGSVAHADPAAELPAAFVALDARFALRSAAGVRWVSARDFFASAFVTALRPDELLVEIELPPPPDRTGHAFVEVAPRHGDFAVGGAAALVSLDDDLLCSRAVLVFLAAGPTPIQADGVEQALRGTAPTNEALAEVARAAADVLEPSGDIHGSTAYRKAIAAATATDALTLAAERARADLAEAPAGGSRP